MASLVADLPWPLPTLLLRGVGTPSVHLRYRRPCPLTQKLTHLLHQAGPGDLALDQTDRLRPRPPAIGLKLPLLVIGRPAVEPGDHARLRVAAPEPAALVTNLVLVATL
jgi:hypothetical protein